MIYTDVGCCCSLFDVVSSVVFSFCQQVSKQIVCFFFFFFFCFFSPSLSLSPILLFSLSLFPLLCWLSPQPFFFFFFFFSLSLSIPHSPFFSLSLPLLCWLSPQPFFFFFFFFFIIYLFFFFFFLSSFFFLSLVFSVPWSCLSQCG